MFQALSYTGGGRSCNHYSPIIEITLYKQKELDVIRLAKMAAMNNNLYILFRLERKSYQLFDSIGRHSFGRPTARMSITRIKVLFPQHFIMRIFNTQKS